MAAYAPVTAGTRVLLTGGAGFIGSSVLRACLDREAEVLVIDNLDETLYRSARKRRNLAEVADADRYQLARVDVRDDAALTHLLDEHRSEVVIHLAALAGVRPSIAQAARYYDVNVTGTATLLRCARACGVERFVLASSSSVYGTNRKIPFAEDDRVDQPASPYAASKRAMELLAQTDQALHGGHITCLRFFTVYGPRQRPEMAIYKFMDLIARGESVPMFGNGQSGRDYTYIDDIVAGVMAAVERPDGFSVYNLGGDKVVRLSELITCIAEVVGRPANIDPLPDQLGDVPVTAADLTRSRRELNFDPQFALRQGLASMWTWYQRNRRMADKIPTTGEQQLTGDRL